jgi:hypothetical protein
MSSPYSDGPLGLQTPDDYPTVRISRDEAAVRVHERSRMDCSSMASQYVSGLSRRQGHLRPGRRCRSGGGFGLWKCQLSQ